MSEGNGTPPAGRDDGADRETRPPKLCLKRIVSADGAYGFCQLPDGHEVPDKAGVVSSVKCGAIRYSHPPAPQTFKPKK